MSKRASPAAIGAIGMFLWATMMGALSAVGAYVIRIYKDVRGRPAYIVESTVGISTQAERIQS